MDNISFAVFEELSKKEHWDRTYDRIANREDTSSFDLGRLYTIKETDEYLQIAENLCRGTHKWSTPQKLLLAKSGTTKKRVVYMYGSEDRFVLGALYRALGALHEDKIAKNCFSYRRRISTNSAIEYVSSIKKNTSMYGVKLDISAYFNSVNRDHLNRCLEELFGVSTGIRRTMDALFNNDTVLYKGEFITEYKSLIPGCALGSFFANYCLRDLDWYFYNNRIGYARYSDDILIFDQDKAKVKEHLDKVLTTIGKYGLKANPNKFTYFTPDQDIQYLGLKLGDSGIDISDHAKKKLKATIRRWVKAGRKKIEIEGRDFNTVARNIVNRLNWKLYKSYIKDVSKFGWGYYAFRYITSPDSLTEIDFYLRDRLRYLKTGKNNKANVKALTDEDFRELGVLSLYDMYLLFHEDFDYYCEVASLI